METCNNPQEAVDQSSLAVPQTRSDIASILEIKEKDLIYYLYRYEKESGGQLYETFSIPKKNGTTREIMAPILPLKRIQRKLADYLNTIYVPKKNVYGFVRDRNAVDGAKHHLPSKELLNLDLQNFFATVNFGRVRGMLLKAPYNFGVEAATTIAQIACRNNSLPQGAPCSPVLANMVCSHLDTSLIRFAKKYHLVYTRYADDISFSSTQPLNKEVGYKDEDGKVHVGIELENLIHKCGFTINREKVFIQKASQRQLVTGVVVNKKVNVPREYVALTRSFLFYCEKDGVESAANHYISKSGIYYRVPDKVKGYSSAALKNWFREVLIGRISYIGAVKGKADKVYIDLARKCNQLFSMEIFKKLPIRQEISKLINGVILVESQYEENLCNGSAFYLENVGVVTCYHCLKYTIEYDAHSCLYFVDSTGNRSSFCRICRKDILRYNQLKDYAVIGVAKSEALIQFAAGKFDSNSRNIFEEVILLGYPNYSEGDTAKVFRSQVSSRKDNYFGSVLFSVDKTIHHGMSGGPVLAMDNTVIGIIKGGLNTTDEDLYDLESGFVPIEYALEGQEGTEQ